MAQLVQLIGVQHNPILIPRFLGAHPFLLWGWARCVDQASREDIAKRYTEAVRPYGYPDFGT